MSRIETLRGKVARSYCRTIIWVDDEIRFPAAQADHQTPAFFEPYQRLFLPTSTAIQAQGVICQLQPMKPTDDPDIPPDGLKTVIRLSRVADAVILDWHLAGDDATHSVSVINDLLDQKETRFIVILTQHKTVNAEFRHIYQNGVKDGNEFVHLENGKHVAFLQKPEHGGVDLASDILSVIERLMAAAYPDYTHWAALEMAANIKTFVPAWLEALPKGMDWALLSEYCYGKEATAELLVENLLEDLGQCIRPSELETTATTNCKGEDWTHLEAQLEDCNDIDDDVTLNLLSLALPPPEILKELPKMVVKRDHAAIQRFVASQRIFSTFCENVSPASTQTEFCQPGSIYKKVNKDGLREIFVCVSQACDCIKGTDLLLIRGKKEKTTKSGSTILKFNGDCYRFDADAKNLEKCKVVEAEGLRALEGFVKIGQLRSNTTRRLATRFWTYATRSAVNLSTFTRSERRGE